MRIRRRRWRAWLATFAATTIAVYAAASVTSASGTGDEPILVQSDQGTGITLAGSAFSDQLRLDTPASQVSYGQTSGQGTLQVSAAGTVTAPATLAPGVYTASGTDSAPGAQPGTWSYQVRVLAVAPTTFRHSLDADYTSDHKSLSVLAGSAGTEAVATYQADVAQLAPMQLAELYSVVSKDPRWNQIPALLAAAASAAPKSAPQSELQSAKPAAQARSSAGAQPADSVPTEFQPTTCADQGAEQAAFALTIVNDTLGATEAGLVAVTSGLADALDTQVPNAIALSILVPILAASTLAFDGADYGNTLASDCAGDNTEGYIENIDATTISAFDLETSIADSLSKLQDVQSVTTAVTITNVSSELASQLTALQAALEESILSSAQTVQVSVGADAQAQNATLNSYAATLQADLASISTAISSLGEQATQNAGAQAAIPGTLADNLTRVLAETDSTSQSVGDLVGQDTQQDVGVANAGFAAQTAVANRTLTLRIEAALAASTKPPIEFTLPSSAGGYLDSAPVGVDEVVSNDLAAMQAAGFATSATATSALSAAKSALAAKNYPLAFNDYQACYQAIAGGS